MESGGPKEGAT